MMLRVMIAALLIGATWLLRAPLEASMAGHMLVQWPLLIGAGLLCAAADARRASDWNWMGIPGLLLASTALLVWMLPLMLDRAVDDVSVDLVKFASLIGAGVIGRASWQQASTPVRLFFAGNALWMMATVGVILQSTRTRLCSSYLVNDQSWTGIGMVALACALGLAGGIPLLRSSGLLDAEDGASRASTPPNAALRASGGHRLRHSEGQ